MSVENTVDTRIIDFYLKEGTDNLGRSLDDILNCEGHEGQHGWAWMEAAHDWVQWLFPIRKESNFNSEAPVLKDDDVTIFKANMQSRTDMFYNVWDAVDKFLNFLGIESVWYFDAFFGFELTEDFEARKYTWIGPLNHNHLRITRFLSFLSIIGLKKFATDLVEFMKKTAPEKGGWINPRSLEYWEGEGLNAT